MFPSSGLFTYINCPFSKRGLCGRPHCLYKHGAELRSKLSDARKSTSGLQKGNPYAARGAPVNEETQDVCLQELERINKEIETVRHEVEQEQKRLSHYRTVQECGRNTVPHLFVSKSAAARKNADQASYGLTSRTKQKTCSRARKYVVDNSKPRTDLEYDPLSNFSADLKSYSSSDKEQKVKNGQGLKKQKNTMLCNQKKAANNGAQFSQSSSPEPLDDSYEDSVLIIDIPPSPEKKTGCQKLCDSVAGKHLQDKAELKEAKTVSPSLDSPPLRLSTVAFEVASPPASTVGGNRPYTNCDAENNQIPSDPHKNKKHKSVSVNRTVVDLTGCFGGSGRESPELTNTVVERSPEAASPSASTGQQNQDDHIQVVDEEENTILAELLQSELHYSVERVNALQPDNSPQNNSIFDEDPAENSASPSRKRTKQAQTTERPVQHRGVNQWSLLPHKRKTSSKMPSQVQGKSAVNHAPPPAEPAAGCSQGQLQNSSHESSVTNGAESFESNEQCLVKTDREEVIVIDSSSDDDDDDGDDDNELNYSEIELSDSDPMEECYRIFMEENGEDKGNEEQSNLSVGPVEVQNPELNVKPQSVPAKKRVAHEAKHTEQLVTKSRLQPQVLVPLCGPAVSGFVSQPSVTYKVPQVHQRASILSASVKGGQAVVSSSCQRKPETQSTLSPLTQNPEYPQPAPTHHAYMNYIPLGPAVIEVGNNLHLILPQSNFPLPITSNSSPVTSVLTPISQVHASAVSMKQTYHAPAVTPVQKHRTTTPVLIPALTRKPSPSSLLAHSNPGTSASTQAAVHVSVKPVPVKRKLKQQYEAAKDKVPHDVRQRYVNMFTEEFLKTTPNVKEAFEKALAEERTVYNRSVNKLKYQSVAVNALKRLKNQSAAVVKEANEVDSQRFKGSVPLNTKKLKGNDDVALYESLKDYILTEEKLIETNYPIQHPEKPGFATLFADNKKGNTDPLKRICCRCGATYSVSQTGKHIRKEECIYHYGKAVRHKVPGGVETRYSCCEGVMGAPGCQVFQLHVHDSLGLDGFVSTVLRHPSDKSCPGVYSLDCEMCYTIHGLELSRVTVVSSSLQVVYDTFVKPDNEVIDYNTRFSGISEDDVKGNHTSLREVQETLLSFISADTILIGHSLETDLCALKLIHGTVVDTSVVFPHRLGPPHKLSINHLTAEYLRRIIQESVCGHDTAEDAAACMELMLWKLKEDGKMKK